MQFHKKKSRSIKSKDSPTNMFFHVNPHSEILTQFSTCVVEYHFAGITLLLLHMNEHLPKALKTRYFLKILDSIQHFVKELCTNQRPVKYGYINSSYI